MYFTQGQPRMTAKTKAAVAIIAKIERRYGLSDTDNHVIIVKTSDCLDKWILSARLYGRLVQVKSHDLTYAAHAMYTRIEEVMTGRDLPEGVEIHHDCTCSCCGNRVSVAIAISSPDDYEYPANVFCKRCMTQLSNMIG